MLLQNPMPKAPGTAAGVSGEVAVELEEITAKHFDEELLAQSSFTKPPL